MLREPLTIGLLLAGLLMGFESISIDGTTPSRGFGRLNGIAVPRLQWVESDASRLESGMVSDINAAH